jgi:hypothetical protein
VREIDNVCHEGAVNLTGIETKIEVAEWYWMSVDRRDQPSQDQKRHGHSAQHRLSGGVAFCGF